VSTKGLTAVIAQFPVTLDLRSNLSTMRHLACQAPRGSLLVLPEGALSGYAENSEFLVLLDGQTIEGGMTTLAELAVECGIHLFYGSCILEDGRWFNAGIYAGPAGESFVYRKVNLATGERGAFNAGNELPVFSINMGDESVCVAIQLCREIRFPEQWQYLAKQGAQIFIYMTNAVGDADVAPVWRSHLMSRAAENQRFVLCANNAHAAQKCPSMIIEPSGGVLWEALSKAVLIGERMLDLGEVSDWYLGQSRADLFGLERA
jgi:predicted amidohydrolase